MKYSFGPILDGLFTQSNFGIVTRMGVWLQPRPPAMRSFHFAFPDDDDLEPIIELCRPLKLSNFVPTLFRVSNDLYLCGSEGENPEYRACGGKRSISDDGRRHLRESHGLGAWKVSGAFYGPSAAALEPQIQRVRDMFGQSGKARYISHEDAGAIPPLQVAICADVGPATHGIATLKAAARRRRLGPYMVALNYEALPADWPPIRALSVSIAARTAASETRRLKQQRDATPRRQSVRRNTIMIPRDGRLVGEKPPADREPSMNEITTVGL